MAAIYGGHVDRRYPAGTLIVSDGPVNASTDTFTIEILGQQGHGARPHEAIDAVRNLPVPVIAAVHAHGPSYRFPADGERFAGYRRALAEAGLCTAEAVASRVGSSTSMEGSSVTRQAAGPAPGASLQSPDPLSCRLSCARADLSVR